MAITVKHSKVSTIPDGDDASVVRPSDWNEDHVLTGTIPIANGGTNATTAADALTNLGAYPASNPAGYGVGTVTSVTGTSPVSVATGTTTPVVSLAASYGDTQNPYASKTANYVLAAPNGSAGVPTFRALVSADIPTLGTYIPYTGASSAIDLNAQTVTNIAHLGINSTAVPDILLRAYGDNNSTSRIGIRGYSSNASSSSMRIAKFRGTFASPQAPLSGDSLGKFELAGYGTTSSSGYPQASYEGVATENWNAIARGTKALFYVTPNTTITQAVALTLDQDKTATFASTVTATTFSGSGASLTSIPNSALVNSAITINGTSTSLGGSISVGTVTSVTGTSPVVSSGGNTPAISMPAATTSVSGYLTSTDWTTFNNKGSGTVTSVSGTTGRITSTGGTTPVIDLTSGVATAGTTGSSSLIPVVTIDTYGRVTGITTASNPQGTVTSVAALTLGTTGTDLSSSVATGTTTPVITLNVPTASATNRGALSAADWTTFNNKGSGTVTSVSATVPSFLSVSGSPITSSGTLALTYSGTALPILNGGTGQTTASAAFNALSPLTTAGDVLYGGTSGAGTRLAIGTAGQVLTVNAGATAPQWSTPTTGTVTAVSVASANGFAGTSSGGATPALTLTTSISGVLKGNGTAISAATSGTDYSAGTSALTTGILKSTTTTGALSIAVAADFPTLNQNTTGTAATLTTPRNIYGNAFDGSAALTQIIASTYGGTGNGFTKFTGATTAEKTYTLPDANATLLYAGGALGTPSSGTVTNLTGTASININGTVGATTATTGAFTTVSATGVITSTLATGTAPFTVASTTQVANLNAATAGTATSATTATNLASGALGSLPYQNAAGTTLFLAGNTTTTPQFVTSTGASSAATAPTLTSSTGSGSVVLATSPTLVTPALGTPSSGVVTNLTGTASININGTVGATTPAAGTFTQVTVNGSNLNTAISPTGTGTVTISPAGALTINPTAASTINNASIGATTASTGAFTTLSASSTVSGTGFSTYLASPPAIGGTAAAAGSFTTLACTSVTDASSLARNAGQTANTTITNLATFTTGGITLLTQTAAAGTTWRIRAFGQFVAVSSATVRTAQVACFYGSTQLVAITPTVLASTAQTTQWQLEFELTASSTTAIWTAGTLTSRIASATALAIDNAVPASTTFTAGAATLDLRFRVSTAVAAESWVIQSVTMERLK